MGCCVSKLNQIDGENIDDQFIPNFEELTESADCWIEIESTSETELSKNLFTSSFDVSGFEIVIPALE